MRWRSVSPEGELLSQEFLARLRVLRYAFFRQHRGESRGGSGGQTPEFDQHRSYEPGDDPRYIDWHLYARSGKFLLKVFSPEDSRQVSVLIDGSASMRVGGGGKALMAARFAAAFSYLALCANRPLFLAAFADSVLAARGPWRSALQYAECLRFIREVPAGGETRLGRSLAQYLSSRRGRHTLFIISDFLQEEDVLQDIAWLSRKNQGVCLVQVMDDEELEPRLRGAVTVHDAEGPGRLPLIVGQDELDELRELVKGYVRNVQATCSRLAVPYGFARASEPFERVFFEQVAQGLPVSQG